MLTLNIHILDYRVFLATLIADPEKNHFTKTNKFTRKGITMSKISKDKLARGPDFR